MTALSATPARRTSLRPAWLICRFFFSFVAAVMAVSGAADLPTAKIMIAAGLCVDFARAVVWRDRYTLNYWLRQLEKNLANPDLYRASQRSDAWMTYAPLAIFLLHGILWVALARSETWQGSSIVGQIHTDPNLIVNISHIARSYMTETCDAPLSREGAAG